MKFKNLFPLDRFFFSLLLLFLPTQLGYHLWPSWAFILGRRVDYLAPTIYVTDILLILTVVSWIIKEKIKWKMDSGQWTIIKKKFLLNFPIIILFTLFVGVNIFFAASPLVSVYGWIKFFEYLCLGFYIVQTKPMFSFVIPHVLFGVFYSSVIAILQFFFQHSIGGIVWFLGERTFSVDTPGIAKIEICLQSAFSCQLFLRAYGTFPHPNVLGGYLSTMVLLSIPNQKIRIFVFRILTIVLGIVALMLTFSRSAWMAIIIAGTWYMVHGTWFKGKISFALKIFLVAIILGSIFYIGRSFSLADESVVVRQQLNAAAITQWRESPLIGVGLGNFLVNLPKTLPSRQIYFLQPVHNIYLLFLSEVGIVGIGIIAASILLIHGSRNKRHVTQKFNELFLIRTSLFMLLFIGLFDHYPLTLQQGQLLLTLLISLLLAYRHN